MEGKMRRAPDHMTLIEALAKKPHAFDFFQALRRIECAHTELPRIGTAVSVSEEPVRLAQEPAVEFAPAALTRFESAATAKVPTLYTRFFGLFGPNGALPLYLTEYARNPLTAVPEKYARERYTGNRTRPSAAPLVAFSNLFHHRFLSLFYRAWAQAQPTVQLDRPDSDRFASFVGAFIGISDKSLRNCNAVPDHAKLFFAGHLGRQVRNADGLAAMLTGFFRVPVKVEQFVGHWMSLPTHERTALGNRSHGWGLGQGAVIGKRVWDRQHKIRIVLGPLSASQYQSFLPDGANFLALRDLLRTYTCQEMERDVRLVLKRAEVPGTPLGSATQLGWTTWLRPRSALLDAEDLVLDCEAASSRPPNKKAAQPSEHTELKVAA